MQLITFRQSEPLIKVSQSIPITSYHLVRSFFESLSLLNIDHKFVACATTSAVPYFYIVYRHKKLYIPSCKKKKEGQLRKLKEKLKVYYIMSVFSVLFALLGFSYNTWRMEVSEENNNVRTAAFEVLSHLGELEHVILSAHYDNDLVEGNPRKGWIKVGLVVDLNVLITPEVADKALKLKAQWADSWHLMRTEQAVVTDLVTRIDDTRMAIKLVLKQMS